MISAPFLYPMHRGELKSFGRQLFQPSSRNKKELKSKPSAWKITRSAPFLNPTKKIQLPAPRDEKDFLGNPARKSANGDHVIMQCLTTSCENKHPYHNHMTMGVIDATLCDNQKYFTGSKAPFLRPL